MAVIHGGPGAAGEMAPVARELSSGYGVLEPFQTATSVEGQIAELKTILVNNGDFPITLVGFSWGAWLSFMLAADYPEIIKKLILIGSASYEEKYTAKIYETRLNRLSEEDKMEAGSLSEILENPALEDKGAAFARFGKILSKADAYNPIAYESEIIDWRFDIFEGVWKDAAELRKSGKLLEIAKRITCPVVAIHGDYDPHLAEGVQKPLSASLKDFKFVLIEKCGHMPWIEREARDKFYEILKQELR